MPEMPLEYAARELGIFDVDDRKFDDLTRLMAAGTSRRRVPRLAAGSGIAGIATLLGWKGKKLRPVGDGGVGAAAAQVTQTYCGNVICAASPGVCKFGCVCYGYSDGNSRCRP